MVNVLYIEPNTEDVGYIYMKSVVLQLFEIFQSKGLLQRRFLEMSVDQFIEQFRLPHATIAISLVTSVPQNHHYLKTTIILKIFSRKQLAITP